MKLMQDWQIEIVVIEDIKDDEVEALNEMIEIYGSLEAIKEEFRNDMMTLLTDAFESKPSKLDVKLKVFELEK